MVFFGHRCAFLYGDVSAFGDWKWVPATLNFSIVVSYHGEKIRCFYLIDCYVLNRG